MKTAQSIRLDDYYIIFDESLTYLSAFLKEKKYSQILILADSHTAKLCYPKLLELLPELKSAILIETPDGESNKNLDACQEIWAKMLKAHADRKAVLINLGGGVIGDMGGFSAACYKRGIDFIQVPTTVLSQVDSSIGGKLGVDFKYGKNLIGVFKNPVLVLMSTVWLETLDKRQIVNGFAEIFKHALIQSPIQWKILSEATELPPTDFEQVLYDSLLVKKQVVETDPYEKGWRKILNFGHTIGHAIEANSLQKDENPLFHGEAIAVGMIMEAYIGTLTSGFPQKDLEEIVKVLTLHYGHYNIPEGSESTIWEAMLLDKKNQNRQILAVVLKAIGQPDIDVEITKELFQKAFNYYRSLA
ncbi:MAG: 3-dehydroquinate synthase [Chitinophagales bacterium]|nr:3-dehydroquinate synthase [Chitinophagales bacterium]